MERPSERRLWDMAMISPEFPVEASLELESEHRMSAYIPEMHV
jgi:hypothetical protein